MSRNKKAKKYTISVVAEQYGVHPQTLRMYEREGLIKPSRSEKGTRYYTEEDIEQLELILNLTRDLGVNLAGVEIILNMREKMRQMQREFENFLQYIHDNIGPPSPFCSACFLPNFRYASSGRLNFTSPILPHLN
ncbi:MAG TPA: helix-turn-helix transcriptional regulator [Blastocatellia bacterium]